VEQRWSKQQENGEKAGIRTRAEAARCNRHRYPPFPSERKRAMGTNWTGILTCAFPNRLPRKMLPSGFWPDSRDGCPSSRGTKHLAGALTVAGQ
jgi:hypothetical protein